MTKTDTRITEQPLRVNAANLPLALRRAVRRVQGLGVFEIRATCANSSELSALMTALERKFASIGRGTVLLEQACELPGVAHIVIDYTDIGSDSENDPQVTPDEQMRATE
jgi:hypothetical protein